MPCVNGVPYPQLAVDATIADGTFTLSWVNRWAPPIASWRLEVGLDNDRLTIDVPGAAPEMAGPVPDYALAVHTGVWVTPTFVDGTEGVTAYSDLVVGPAYTVEPGAGWSAAPPALIASQRRRARGGLTYWTDGTLGWIRTASGPRSAAANTANVGLVDHDNRGLITAVADPSIIVAANAVFDYAGGGPILTSGTTHAMAVHLERYDPTNTAFYASLGIARSLDNGASWTLLGEVITPHIAVDDPNRFGAAIDVGAGPLLEVGGHVLCWFYETTVDAGLPLRRGIGVARCATLDFWDAVSAGDPPTFTKLDDGDAWAEPGISGLGKAVVPPPAGRWFDVAVIDDDLVLVASDGAFHDWQLLAATSPDGLAWSDRVSIPGGELDATEGAFVSLTSRHLADDPKTDTHRHAWLWRLRSTDSGFARWNSNAWLERIPITVGPST